MNKEKKLNLGIVINPKGDSWFVLYVKAEE